MKEKGISIIVPFLNEEDIIHLFCTALDKYQAEFPYALELIFVDDGSNDKTIEKIQEYSFRNINKVKIVQLSRNYGSHSAVRAGLQIASNDIATWMGSDLQEPLNLLDQGISKINEGYDAVYFEKETVKVSKFEKMFSNIYAWLMRKYAVKNFESGGINTIMINKKIIQMLNNNVEANSSVILQILDSGYKHCTISLNYNERSGGKSKWTLSKKIKLFIDSFVSFSFVPIRLVSLVGIFMFLFGCIIGISTLVNKILNPSVPIGYSTLASIVSLGFGITNIALGIMAEYLWRTYDAARKRPVFIVSEVINVTDEEANNSREDYTGSETEI